MSILIELIRQHAATDATAGDWSAVAETIRGLNLRQPSRKCGSVETAAALAAVGVNWAAVMDLIDDDATGRFILTMLAAEGVQWGHVLTVPYLRAKQGAVLTAVGVDALIDLSSPLRFSSLTADDCRIGIETAEADESAKRTAATRSARITSIESLDAETIVFQNGDLNAALEAIRNSLLAFGGW